MASPRAILLALVALVLTAVCMAALPADAGAISRKKAEAAAIKALKPDRAGGRVVVFGLPRALKPRQSVFQTGSPKATRKQPVIKVRSLGRKAWLFWMDQLHGARFQHSSTMLLIDDRTGKPFGRRKLVWWPVIDGKDPPFRRGSGYTNGRFEVARNFPRAGSALAKPLGDVTPKPPAKAAQASVIPAGSFNDDCVIMIGLMRDKDFDNDFPELRATLRSVGITKIFTVVPRTSGGVSLDPDGEDLRKAVKTAISTKGCKDVMLYIDGHGVGGGQGPPAVNTGHRFIPVATPAGQPQKYRTISRYVYATDIQNILTDNPSITFKIKIDSCYSGRFALELPKEKYKNMLVLEVSSGPGQVGWSYIPRIRLSPSGSVVDEGGIDHVSDTDNPGNRNRENGLGEFTNGNLAGIERFAASATEVANAQAAGGSLLARMLERSFTLGASEDFARKIGLTIPRLVSNLPAGGTSPPPPPPPPSGDFTVALETSHFHRMTDSDVCVNISTSPAQPGASAKVTVSGPGVVGPNPQTVTLDASGKGFARVKINSFGTYTVGVEVTSGGVTKIAVRDHDVDASAGTCPAG